MSLAVIEDVGAIMADRLGQPPNIDFALAAFSVLANMRADATSAIFAQGWTPELQKMVGGKQDAAGLLKAVQEEYQKELTQ